MKLLDACVSARYTRGADALREVEISIEAGEMVGLIGESGSGKSTLALALLRLLDERKTEIRGCVEFEECDLLSLPERRMREIRGNRISLVLQSPLSALNPMLTIGAHFRETWIAHEKRYKGAWKPRAAFLLERVSLPSGDDFLRRYPREISVGQAQRALIAMAIMHNPSLLIADEPTSSLDTITQSEILRLFRDLNSECGTAMLIISHDLLSVANLCSRISILRQGQLIESGPVRQVFDYPRHEYTERLIGAISSLSWRE